MNSYDYMRSGMGRSTHRGVLGLGQGDISTYLDASGAPVSAGDPSAVFGLDSHGNLVNIATGTTLPGGTDTMAGTTGTNLCSLYPAMCVGSGTPLTSATTPPPNKPQPTSTNTYWLIGGAFLFLMIAMRR